MAEKIFIIGSGAGVAGYILYYILKKKSAAEEHYESMRSTKIWSIDELRYETLKNNTNPAYPSTLNYEEYAKFNNVLVQGEFWCDPSRRIKGKIKNYKNLTDTLKNSELDFNLELDSKCPEYMKLNYKITKRMWYNIYDSRPDLEDFSINLYAHNRRVDSIEIESKARLYLAQPVQSGLGLRYGGIGGLSIPSILQKGIDVFSAPKKEETLEKIELKGLRVKDLKKFQTDDFKNVRVSRVGFEPAPTMIQLMVPVLGGTFSEGFSLRKAISCFDLTFRESEWGLKVGTPAFIFGNLVVDKVSKDVYFDHILGSFRTKKEFLNYLRDEVESYSLMLFLFGIFAAIGTAFTLNYIRDMIYSRNRRRR